MFGLNKFTIAAAAVGGLIAGSAAGIVSTKLVFENIVIPAAEKAAEEAKTAAVKLAKDRCEITMTAAITVAAEKAKTAERDRLQAIHEKALNLYRAAVVEREEALKLARQEQEQKDRDHEQQLKESGRSCPLDSNDIDYLDGVQRIDAEGNQAG